MAVRELSAAATLLRADELLEVTYRSGDLGNLPDPLGETVFILLSRQTQDPVFRATFETLRERYPAWLDVLQAPQVKLEELLAPSGFRVQRAEQLHDLLNAVNDANKQRRAGPWAEPPGDLTLDFLQEMDDEDVHAFLLELPGIGEKSARCIMSYALDRAVFAVDTHIRRVFARLGLVPYGKGKVKHEQYDSLVPPAIRKRLHVNLIHHGRRVCTASKPKCGDCVLVSFCSQGRQTTAEQPGNKPPIVDLCAGAGGLSEGFKETHRPVAAVEHDREAAQTYRANHRGVPVLEADVTVLESGELVDFTPAAQNPAAVVSGTPCQGYSAAGARKPDDPRNTMYQHVIRIAQGIGARSVVLENVPGLERVNGTEFTQRIRDALEEAFGWSGHYVLTASDYGVPQNRRRFIFIAAALEDLAPGAKDLYPEPTHRAANHQPKPASLWDDAPGDDRRQQAELPQTKTLREALEGLPELGVGEDAEYRVVDGILVLNGSTMRHSDRVIEKIRNIKQGEGPISYRRLTDDVARTLVAGHRAMPVHPWLHRTISVREAARIQDFPDSYVFCGFRGNQPLQVANAVPPPLAAAVARHHQRLLQPQALQPR